jgi:hypothetical protein
MILDQMACMHCQVFVIFFLLVPTLIDSSWLENVQNVVHPYGYGYKYMPIHIASI